MSATADGDAGWTRRPERSNLAVLRLMVWLSLRLGRPISRLVLYGIAAYFLAFAPRARRASATYLARVLGRQPTLAERYRHVLAFASTIHDRVYLLNDHFDLYDIEIVGEDLIRAAMAGGHGVLLLGAHLGSFEVMRALGRRHAGRGISMLMYEENARKINATLAAVNPAAVQDIIPLGRMASMLAAKEKLDAGHLVGMLADRAIERKAGGDPSRAIDFLGVPAPFPVGPFRVAAMLRRPVLFMTGLYLGGNRYRIHFESLADFSSVERAGRDAAIEAAQRAYVGRLEQHCRAAPCNWFNFFDFWRET
ncbi:MAG: acyl-CoA synthetase [Rhodocyclaceae bacterium]|nr:acyl-CoA synthetase [Rhodocyclaceae bacterium]